MQRTHGPVLRLMQMFACLTILSLAGREAMAAPSTGQIFEKAQPDGTVVEVRIFGDEHYRRMESLEGYTVVRNRLTGYICYARLSDDETELIPTTVPANLPPPPTMHLERHLRIKPESIRSKVLSSPLSGLASPEAGLQLTTTGEVLGICLLIEFPDERGTIPDSEIRDMLNKSNYSGYGNNGSVKDYFFDVSDSKLTYTSAVTSAYYTAPYNKAYYDENPHGIADLIADALHSLDSSVDFSRHDSNGDGYIDAVTCLFAGSSGDTYLWPHSDSLTFYADGVAAHSYALANLGTSPNIGVICHETGHMLLDWPDLYDYDYDSAGLGDYCLMSTPASHNPVEPCAYLKYITGWASVTTLDRPRSDLPLIAQWNSFYKYPHPTRPNEYFLFSCRRQSRRDQSLPDEGLAVWHIDTEGDNNLQQMLPDAHYLVTLVQADGRWDLEKRTNYGDSTDLFDGSSFDNFGPQTVPNSHWWDGSESGLRIHSISTPGNRMTFSFGIPPDSPPIALDEAFETNLETPIEIELSARTDHMPAAPSFLRFVIRTLPRLGRLRDPDTGPITDVPHELSLNRILYTPYACSSGSDDFRFDATAPLGRSNTATISLNVNAPQHTIFSEDFDSGADKFRYDNTYGAGYGLWGRSTACVAQLAGHSPPTVFYYGSDSTCSYETGRTEGLAYSAYINLTRVPPPISLEFNYFLETEQSPDGFDSATVLIKDYQESLDYEILSNDDGSLPETNGQWSTKEADISFMSGRIIQLMFIFTSGDEINNNYRGFAIDDVRVSAQKSQLRGDVNQDSRIDFVDFALLAESWMTQSAGPAFDSTADIAEPADSRIDPLDLQIMADCWLGMTLP